MDGMKKFMNIWEIEANFKCPVVGAMLSVDKHRQILKKCGWDVNQMKPYEYHATIMGCLSEENAVSVKVNNYIRHQARSIMARVAELHQKGGPEKIRALWTEEARSGRIGPAMYAIVSHEDADIELLQDVHGEVHMLAHANMTEVFEVRKQLDTAHQNLTREKEKLADKHARVKALIGERKTDSLTISRLQQENQTLAAGTGSQDKGADEEKNSHTQDLEDRIAALEDALADAEGAARAAEREKRQMEIQVFGLENENQLIRDEMETLLASLVSPLMEPLEKPFQEMDLPCAENRDCSGASCPNYRLCAQRIFMVGGITKMKSYYRDMVEQAGGQFDYHDGYMKQADAALAARVKRCDVVVCPVNCNSHNACLRVKKLCRRYNKEFKVLSSASLSALAQALLVPEGEAAGPRAS